MKRTSKKLLAVLLSAMIGISAVASMNTFAAEETQTEAAEAVEIEEVSEPVEETEPTTAEPTTEPTTSEPTTEPQPTTKPAPTVGAVKNLVKTNNDATSVSLKWDKVAGATGYYVYVCNRDKTTTYTKTADVKTNTATIKNLEHTTQYWFKVSAYIKQDGKIYEGNATVKKTATNPVKIANIAQVRSSNVIQFKWTRNKKATGYKIYRSCYKTNGKSVLYKTITNNSTTTFTDTNVEDNRLYYYSVQPYLILYNNASYHGPKTTVRFLSGLGAPNFTMTTQVSRVSLSWNKNNRAEGYGVFYSTSQNGKYKLLANTKKTFYNTPKLTPGKTYYFRVQPYKHAGQSKLKITGSYNTRSIKVGSGAYGKTVGNTYIEVSLKQQHMWFYKDGKLIVETDVVTGNNDGYCNTPKGCYSIYQRTRNTTLVGPGYSSFVNYWLAFKGGYGIHDASWRSSYGGNIYNGNGSHGCVNTPYSKVQKIYNNVSIGTPVVIY